MSDWLTRKKFRKEYYVRFVEGAKLVKCVACNGSGYYDIGGSPRCGMCQGTGKVRKAP